MDRLLYFFPFQLVWLHLKRNHFLLLFWVILFGFTTQAFANKFGIPYLFLAPEYRGVVGIWSYAILGFALGGFIMAFNIYSYIIHSKRFPFLGTLARPFFKFCINNFIIPVLFIGTYIYFSSKFLQTVELKNNWEIFKYMLAFVLGNALFIILAVIYFFPTNKNIFKITGQTAEQFDALSKKHNKGLRNKSRFGFNRGSKWRVETYLSHPFKVNLARNSDHYDRETLRKVFYQNHVNASFFELLVILVFFVIGAFQFNNFFVIPAAASTFLVFTVVLMIISITMSWLKGWTLTVLIALILLVDFASGKLDWINMANPAYGLNYEQEPVPYNLATLDSLNSNLIGVSRDIEQHEKILNKWLDKQRKLKGDPTYKPKMIIVNTSGGGLRSSLWTVRALQYCDSVSKGQITQNIRLISGSSGGSIGAAYFRDLYLNKETINPGLYSEKYQENISKDILNRVLFTFATNDIFIRFRKRDIGGYSYVLDRGMTFEDQLNINTDFVFDKPVNAYAEAVADARIPMMILAPSIVNDGRRMLISSQPLSYLCYENPDERKQLNLSFENIEFARMFANHDAKNLLMSSALRMNSTFPYILPYPSLPTEPSIEVMDAGLRDNFGMKVSAKYISVFKKWIEKNTSGLIILQIRDTEKLVEPNIEHSTILDKMVNPIGSFYGNYFNDQDYNMDQILDITNDLLDVPLYHIPLEIRNNPGEHIALSWHLTELEKLRVTNSIELPWNQESIKQLLELLDE
ncbi:hypothetical protein G3O08_01490 [Cryomorpha ignava]|uniref:PNPLA domain-containing protein n=1 Tax=Cryomorpha ignava TaxID=101383 RepID=A0A7K3WN96_9FLAO|nr:patatin-like phospholipase family protein [Cryomorpha ignava]NEN22175.1 hypothetical protein [Cryomorpha ignava]